MPKLWRSKGGEHSRVDATWTAVWAGGGLCVAPDASPCVSRRREAVALARVGWGEGEERAALRESCIHADVGSFGLHARREARDAGRRPGRLGEASGAGSRERGALHSWRERGGGGGRCAGSLLLRLWPLANAQRRGDVVVLRSPISSAATARQRRANSALHTTEPFCRCCQPAPCRRPPRAAA